MSHPTKSIVKVLHLVLKEIHPKTAFMKINLRDGGSSTWLLKGEILMPYVAGMDAFATQSTIQSLCVAKGHDVQSIDVTDAEVQRRAPEYLTFNLDMEIDK